MLRLQHSYTLSYRYFMYKEYRLNYHWFLHLKEIMIHHSHRHTKLRHAQKSSFSGRRSLSSSQYLFSNFIFCFLLVYLNVIVSLTKQLYSWPILLIRLWLHTALSDLQCTWENFSSHRNNWDDYKLELSRYRMLCLHYTHCLLLCSAAVFTINWLILGK